MTPVTHKQVYLDTGKKIIRFNTHDIIYIRKSLSKTYLYTSHHEFVRIFNIMEEMSKKLNAAEFFRANDEFLVNLNYMATYLHCDNELVLSEGTHVKVASHRVKELLKVLENWN